MHSIGIYEFNQLDDNSKYELLLKEGVFLTNYKTPNVGRNLHRLSDFYVEVVYDSTDNQISKLKAFKSERLLEPYLDGIEISELLG